MSVSTKVEYGLRALFYLAQQYQVTRVTSREIADRQQVPAAYLDHLLLALRNAGLVNSVRGPGGGHTLARHPASITLAEAVEALEGGPLSAESPESRRSSDMPLEIQILSEIWGQVEAAAARVLQSVTLEDLCQHKLSRERRIMYYI